MGAQKTKTQIRTQPWCLGAHEAHLSVFYNTFLYFTVWQEGSAQKLAEASDGS